jgi:HTH-type transcriptional regulator/antitoxin HipB
MIYLYYQKFLIFPEVPSCMNDIGKIAEQLAAARKARGLSQEALARKLGMKQSQISDIEAGKRNVRVGTLIDVGRAIGLELVLVPRSLLPAISYVIQSAKGGQQTEQRSIYESWTEEEGKRLSG